MKAQPIGEWLIEEPYALIGHVRFCEGLLRLEPLIAKEYMMKGCEKSRQGLLDDIHESTREIANAKEKEWLFPRATG